jgi:hypothetical protein
MFRHAWRIAAAGLLLITVGANVEAQEIATSFDQLRLRIKAGDTVTVNDASGHAIKGSVASLSPSSIALLWKGGGTTLAEADVTSIRQLKRASLAKGAAWGLGIGSAVGLAVWGGTQVYGSICECSTGNSGASVPLFAALGTGIGVGLAARVREKVVFLRPGKSTAEASALATLTFSPLVTRSRRGVLVSYGF